jgi:chaperonin GroES
LKTEVLDKTGVKDSYPSKSGKLDKAPMRMLQDLVLVRRDPPEIKYNGLLYVPHIAQEKCLKGTVLAVGPGMKWDDGSILLTQLKPGDRIVFTESINVPYGDVVEDGALVTLRERDVIGILED